LFSITVNCLFTELPILLEKLMDRSSGNVLQVYVKLIIDLFLILKIINNMDLHLEESIGAEKTSVLDYADFMSFFFAFIFRYGKRVGRINCLAISEIKKVHGIINCFRACLE
jgi:hypothetical protein